VGQDTDAVLARDLGLDVAQLAALRSAGVTDGPTVVPVDHQKDAV
jgi:hypothetical protein